MPGLLLPFAAMISPQAPSVTSAPFGKSLDGEAIELYKLVNAKGVTATVATYGATLIDLITPDRNGVLADIALGFDSIEPYFTLSPYFGATVGRFANRIANGRFTLDGKAYQLSTNDGPNTLHGGLKAFDKRIWKAEVLSCNAPSVRFTLHSPDGEEGFPGAMDVSVTYTLTDENELQMVYTAVADKKTIINLTNHTYFNLKGAGNGTILGHVVAIPASEYTPSSPALVPTGEIKSVEGTPLDFRKPAPIGSQIEAVGGTPLGFDHNYVISKGEPAGVQLQADVYEPETGRTLQVLSDQPGVQFYTGNFLDGSYAGKCGKTYPQHSGFCFEPQHFPDSPNQPHFPSVILNPGESFRTEIIFRFGTK